VLKVDMPSQKKRRMNRREELKITKTGNIFQ